MAVKSTNAFKEFNENLAKAFRDASVRFRKQFEKGLEAQRQAIKGALKMSPNLEEFNRQLTTAFRVSGEQFRKGLEQAFGAQREAMRKVAPDIKKGLSELPMARLGSGSARPHLKRSAHSRRLSLLRPGIWQRRLKNSLASR